MTPSTAIQRPDLGLALLEFDLEMSQQGFIAQKVFPVIDVALATANFARVILKELLSSPNTARAPGTAYSRGQSQFQQDNYATKENGHEEPVDDNESKMYAYTIDSELIAAMRARDVILRNYESRVAAKVFDTATWTGASYTTGVSTPWSTIATATPITDVVNATKKVYTNFGIRPNTMVINWLDFKNLRECSQIIDRIKYSGKDDPKNVTTNMLAEVFDLEQVLVADAIYNSANQGANVSLSSVWSSGNAMICRTAKTRDLREPCIGRTFNWTGDGGSIGGTFEEYRWEPTRSTIIRCRHQTDEKRLNTECGHLLTGI